MKRSFFNSSKVMLMALFTLYCSLFTSYSQSPNRFSYQAVVRNSGGILVQNGNVGFKISILQGTSTGTVVYSETQVVATNNNGLATMEIGGGSVVSGTFSTIDWSAGPYFLKTETDPAGGTSYTITGTTQLLSVPYALYAAKSGTPGIAAGSIAGNTPYWNGSTWVTNSSNIFNNGGNIGIGTATPASRFDIAGGNNWDVVNGEGDFRVGNNQYRLKLGVALGGGGAGAVGIMQYGQPGGYNVLSLGAQGNNLLYLNGGSQSVGIGTDNPAAALDIISTTQGFLPPRMTQVQRNALNPVTGLILYNITTNKPNYYNGFEWQNFDGTLANDPLIGNHYGGGILAYILQAGDPGYDPNLIHGLIAAPSDQSSGIQWYNGTYTITGATATAIGTGNSNTNTIVSNQGTGIYAAQLCYDLILNGYSDWYLPSKDELNKLYLNKLAIGGFTNAIYWSSSEFPGGSSQGAWDQSLNSGVQSTHFKNSSLNSVRAIRSF
jgi:hypothetical protein